MNRPRFSLGIALVGIAYLALLMACTINTVRDGSRPDLFAASPAVLAAGNVIPRLMSGEGRALRGSWGFAGANLAALAALLLYFQLANVRVDAGSSIPRMLLLNFGLPWLTILVGLGAAKLARRGDDPVN